MGKPKDRVYEIPFKDLPKVNYQTTLTLDNLGNNKPGNNDYLSFMSTWLGNRNEPSSKMIVEFDYLCGNSFTANNRRIVLIINPVHGSLEKTYILEQGRNDERYDTWTEAKLKDLSPSIAGNFEIKEPEITPDSGIGIKFSMDNHECEVVLPSSLTPVFPQYNTRNLG